MNAERKLEVVLGTSEGKVKTYDLRYPGAVRVLKHPYMMPVHTIEFHTQSEKLVTADQKSIR
jgi:hypothetical protein